MSKDTIENRFHELVQVIETAGLEAKTYFFKQEAYAEKTDGSVLTEVDTRTERAIRDFVTANFPDDSIVGEEDDTIVGNSGFVWFIDPIDGTENFVRKIPFFSITATRLGPTPEDSFSIIHNPVSGQTFASLMEDGVYENQNVVQMTAETIGSKYVVNVTCGKGESWYKPARYALTYTIALEYGKSAVFSSALLEYAYLAAGRIDGFINLGLEPWDSAAGLYLVKAAGGAISTFTDETWQRYTGAIRDLYGPDYQATPIIFASHPDIHEQFCDFIGNPRNWAEKVLE